MYAVFSRCVEQWERAYLKEPYILEMDLSLIAGQCKKKKFVKELEESRVLVIVCSSFSCSSSLPSSCSPQGYFRHRHVEVA